MKKANLLTILLLLFILPGMAVAQTAAEDSTIAVQDSLEVQSSASELATELARIDSLDLANQHAEAYERLQKLAALHPDHYGVMWRLSRQTVEMGMQADDKDTREEYFQTATDLAKKAVELNPDHEEGHLRWAVAAGRLALLKGGDEKIKLSREIKEQALAVLEIAPDHAGAHFIFGRWHESLANLGWLKRTLAKMIYGDLPEASNEEAIAYMEKAIELDPDFIEYRVFTGETYIERFEAYDKARPHLQKAVELPPDRPGDKEFQEQAQKLLDKIKDK